MVAASPPTLEFGMAEGSSPAPMGRMPNVVIANVDQDGNPTGGGYTDGTVRPARKRGPGVMWSYDSALARVEMLTMPGDALKPIDDDARDLRAKIAESMGVVFVDPNDASFSAELSGKAIARLYDRQIRLCDKEREDFGDNALLPLVDMLLRIALHSARTKPGALYLPGLKEALPVLERFEQPVGDDEAASLSWFPIPFDLNWGPYFQPDAAEEKATVEMIAAAQAAGLITQYSGVEKVRDIFGIKSVAEYMQDLEKENAAKAAKQQADLAATLDITADHEAHEESGATGVPKGAPGKPAAAAALGGKPKGKLRGGRPAGGKPARGF